MKSKRTHTQKSSEFRLGAQHFAQHLSKFAQRLSHFAQRLSQLESDNIGEDLTQEPGGKTMGASRLRLWDVFSSWST
jgi:hypothetical protein